MSDDAWTNMMDDVAWGDVTHMRHPSLYFPTHMDGWMVQL